jgi:hypothetical protein
MATLLPSPSPIPLFNVTRDLHKPPDAFQRFDPTSFHFLRLELLPGVGSWPIEYIAAEDA